VCLDSCGLEQSVDDRGVGSVAGGARALAEFCGSCVSSSLSSLSSESEKWQLRSSTAATAVAGRLVVVVVVRVYRFFFFLREIARSGAADLLQTAEAAAFIR